MRKTFFGLAAALAGFVVAAYAQDGVPDPLPSAPEMEWRASDTEAGFVQRIRERSSALGEECDADEAAFAAIASGATAALQGEAVAGKPMTLEWQLAEASSSAPAWFVASFDRPVRFAGQGFYALTPGAIAPFGLAAGKGTTRALVALFGPEAPTAGRLDIVPLESGPLQVELSIAGFVRRCAGEAAFPFAQGTLSVAPSTDAIFLVRDPFSFDRPVKTLASPNGATRTEVYDGRYRLIEAESGAILADRDGRRPAYSPTGRFLAALAGEGYDVIDTVDGALVSQMEAGDLGWENADSFLVNGEAEYGAADLRNPLVAGYRPGIGDILLDCTACSGFGTRLAIDLENDVAVRVGGQGYALSRLSGGEVVSGSIDTFDEDVMAEAAQSIEGFFSAMQAAPPHIPQHWNFRGGLKFSSLTNELRATGDKPFDAWLAAVRKAVLPEVEAPQASPPPPETLQATEIGQGRGASRLARPRVRDDAMVKRLADFGLAFGRMKLPSFAKTGPLDEDGDMRIAERIAASVPAAKTLFAPVESFGCLPDAATEASPRIFGYFNNALEFKLKNRTLWLTLLSCKWTSGGTYEPNFYLFDSAAAKPVRLGDDNPDQPNGGQCDANIGYCGIEARLYADRYLLIWSRESRALAVYDIKAGKTIFQRYGIERGELLKEASYTADGGHVVQINTDGSFYVYALESQQRTLSGRYVDDEVVVWTPDLRFDASPEGANYVNLRFPGRQGQYTFQQFSSLVRRTGLLGEVMAGGYTPSAAPIGVPPTISGQIRLEGGRIVGDIATQGAAEVRVYQDGLRTDAFPVGAPVAGAEGKLALDVAHAAGARWISLVAAGGDGLVSLPVGRSLAGDGQALPVVHALTIGVDRYDAPGIANLSFARSDARTLAHALTALSGKSVRMGLNASLSDGQATPAAILSQAGRMVEAAKAGETVVVSFAGHGLAGPDGRFYMAASGTRLDDIAGTALAWDDLARVLVKSRARVVVFLDACHSGAAGTSLFASNDDAAAGMLATVPSGLLVFSASKGRQFSEEAAATGGGVFTNAVADVIARRREAYDLDHNGAIEVSELYAGVKRRVSELTQGRQVPWLARNEMIGDFSLF